MEKLSHKLHKESQHEIENGKKHETISFEDGSSVEIPFVEKEVNFPEHLVAETGGVEGYTRKIVSWEDYGEAFNTLVPDETISKLDVPDEVKQELLKLGHLSSLEQYKKVADVIDWNISEMIPKGKLLWQKIVGTLGDDFVEKTNIHLYKGFWGGQNDPGADVAFAKEMILQRVFDPGVHFDILYGHHEYSAKIPYNKIEDGGVFYGNIEGPPEIPDKTTNQIIDDLKQKQTFLISNQDLSITNGGFWPSEDNVNYHQIIKPFFGFSQENKVYAKYLSSCLDLFGEINDNVKSELAPLWDNMRSKFISFEDYEKKRDILQRRIASSGNTVECLTDLIKTGKSNVYDKSDNPHPQLPIVTGYPGIPELRWCHAAYASIPTKKGLNILKMKT